MDLPQRVSYFSCLLFPLFLKHQSIIHNCTRFSYLYWLYYLKRKKKIIWSFFPPSHGLLDQGSPRQPLKYFLFLEKSNVFSIILIRITEQWDTCLFFLIALKTSSLSYCTSSFFLIQGRILLQLLYSVMSVQAASWAAQQYWHLYLSKSVYDQGHLFWLRFPGLLFSGG